MAASLLVALVDRAAALLGEMGTETQYNLDYDQVVRILLPFDQEPNRRVPLIQLGLLGTEEGGANNAGLGDFVSHDQLRHMDLLVVQFHLEPERRADGTLDVLTPMANGRADVFRALIGQTLGTRHLGSEFACLYWRRSEGGPVQVGEEIGGTVREVYGIEWDHAMSGMDTVPGG